MCRFFRDGGGGGGALQEEADRQSGLAFGEEGSMAPRLRSTAKITRQSLICHNAMVSMIVLWVANFNTVNGVDRWREASQRHRKKAGAIETPAYALLCR